MTALVISDSHGDHVRFSWLMQSVVPKEKPQTLICCGDGVRDALPYIAQFERALMVRGNCDFSAPPDIPARLTARLNGVEVFITHGHRYHVKQGVHVLCYAALEAQAQVACFGHTHTPLAQWQQGILLCNPGALRDGHYGLLRMEPDKDISFELCRL